MYKKHRELCNVDCKLLETAYVSSANDYHTQMVATPALAGILVPNSETKVLIFYKSWFEAK